MFHVLTARLSESPLFHYWPLHQLRLGMMGKTSLQLIEKRSLPSDEPKGANHFARVHAVSLGFCFPNGRHEAMRQCGPQQCDVRPVLLCAVQGTVTRTQRIRKICQNDKCNDIQLSLSGFTNQILPPYKEGHVMIKTAGPIF